jgi:hypothetical protein
MHLEREAKRHEDSPAAPSTSSPRTVDDIVAMMAFCFAGLACESERKLEHARQDRLASSTRPSEPVTAEADEPRDEGQPARPREREPKPAGSEIFDHVLGGRDQSMSASQLVAAPNGRLIAFGSLTQRPSTTSEFLVIGFDELGVVDWERRYSELVGKLPAAAVATDAGVLFAAHWLDSRPWLGRVDSETGELGWTKAVHDRHCRIEGLTTVDGDLLAAGYCRGPFERVSHPWVGRFSNEGERRRA